MVSGHDETRSDLKVELGRLAARIESHLQYADQMLGSLLRRDEKAFAEPAETFRRNSPTLHGLPAEYLAKYPNLARAVRPS
jgi:hypothetical protein